MVSTSRVAVVTGANKGIGLEIAKLLAGRGIKTIMTSRNEELGLKEVSELRRSMGDATLDYCQLDITDSASIERCAKTLQERYSSIDILINNAGIAYKGSIFGAEEAAATIKCNLKGTRRTCEAILPMMKQGGRIVNVCSRAGLLRQLHSKNLVDGFVNPKDADSIEALADSFVTAIRNNSVAADGWSNSMYGISKLSEISYSKLLARELEPKGILVYSCCPGYCVTDMTSQRGNKTAAEGADTPVWLALDQSVPPTGCFCAERQVTQW